MRAQGFQTPQAISLQGRFGVNHSYLWILAHNRQCALFVALEHRQKRRKYRIINYDKQVILVSIEPYE